MWWGGEARVRGRGPELSGWEAICDFGADRWASPIHPMFIFGIAREMHTRWTDTKFSTYLHTTQEYVNLESRYQMRAMSDFHTPC